MKIRNEASLIDGIDIVVVKNITDVVNFIENGVKIPFEKIKIEKDENSILDFSDVKGQYFAKEQWRFRQQEGIIFS